MRFRFGTRFDVRFQCPSSMSDFEKTCRSGPKNKWIAKSIRVEIGHVWISEKVDLQIRLG